MVETIAARVQHVREIAGLSRSALSQLAGLAQTHVGLIERKAEANPQVSTLTSLSRVLGVSIDWLATGEGVGPTEDAVREAVARALEDKRTKS